MNGIIFTLALNALVWNVSNYFHCQISYDFNEHVLFSKNMSR